MAGDEAGKAWRRCRRGGGAGWGHEAQRRAGVFITMMMEMPIMSNDRTSQLLLFEALGKPHVK